MWQATGLHSDSLGACPAPEFNVHIVLFLSNVAIMTIRPKIRLMDKLLDIKVEALGLKAG
jgi:hypothetical protein